MLLEDLVGVIESLRERIRSHDAVLRENETRTRMALIDPLLQALGWDVSDPEVVTPEYKVSDGWADYALLRSDGQPAATVEAKKMGEPLDSHRMQMLNYSNAWGVEYAGLTRQPLGIQSIRAGQVGKRRILDISIAERKSALKLLLLWPPNLNPQRADCVDPPIPVPGETSPGATTSMGCAIQSRARNVRFWDGSEKKLEHWKEVFHVRSFTGETSHDR